MASKATLIEMMWLLTTQWPKEVVGDERQGLYETMLADLPDEAIMAATKRCLAECTWFPMIAEIRKRANEVMTPPELTSPALEAWGAVREQMRKPTSVFHNGESHKLAPLDALTERAVRDVGGWAYLRMSEDAMSDRARFCEVYSALQTRARESIGMLPEVRALAERLRLERPQQVPALEQGR